MYGIKKIYQGKIDNKSIISKGLIINLNLPQIGPYGLKLFLSILT
jgi:hypothetical protein